MSRDAKESKITDGSRRSRLIPILSNDFTEDIPLEKVYVGRLRDKRDTSRAMRLLSTVAGGVFGHLKRCNDSRLLLSRIEESKDELKNSLSSKGFDLSLLEDEIEIFEIPSKPAKTKRQAEICGKIWPVNFHPDRITESIISGELFNEAQYLRMESLMELTIEAARMASIGNSECNGSALIVEPESGQPIALAASRIDEHPLWHSSMLAIDLVARIQGGGAWDLIKDEKIHQTEESGKRKFREDIPLCYPSRLSDINFPKAEPLQVSSGKSRQKSKRDDDALPGDHSLGEFTKTGPYLCTNFWIFLVQEPCALCAMALLHSRASRIFYGVKRNNGVLGSKALLHTTPGLNHRYQVWSGILEKECKAVCEEIQIRELKTS